MVTPNWHESFAAQPSVAQKLAACYYEAGWSTLLANPGLKEACDVEKIATLPSPQRINRRQNPGPFRSFGVPGLGGLVTSSSQLPSVS
jgi:hypothetical protein